MQASAAVPLVAIALWMSNAATPAEAGNIRPARESASTDSFRHQYPEELTSNFPASFDPTSTTYVFEGLDSALVADAASCGGRPSLAARGSGAGGSKRRHAPPVDTKPCTHNLEDSDAGVPPMLDVFEDSPGCAQAGSQTFSRPI